MSPPIPACGEHVSRHSKVASNLAAFADQPAAAAPPQSVPTFAEILVKVQENSAIGWRTYGWL
jgi:hypothetical protein